MKNEVHSKALKAILMLGVAVGCQSAVSAESPVDPKKIDKPVGASNRERTGSVTDAKYGGIDGESRIHARSASDSAKGQVSAPGLPKPVPPPPAASNRRP